MYSQWISFTDKASGFRVEFKDGDETQTQCRDKALQILQKPENCLSYRFELCVPSNRNNGFVISVRAVPATVNYLNDDVRLSSSDVSSMLVQQLPVISYKMPPYCSELSDLYPCGAVTFSDTPILREQYKKALIDGFRLLMFKFRVLKDCTYEEVRTFLQETKRASGNVRRFPNLPVHSGREMTEPSENIPTGTYMFSKYGCSFSLFNTYMPQCPAYLQKFFSLAMATSSWKSYRSGWEAFFCFNAHIGSSFTLPASAPILIKFVLYLAHWRKLKIESIRSYLSHVKMLHKGNKCNTSQFSDFHLGMTLQGIENWQCCLNLPGLVRNVFSFEVLQVWGHALFSSNLARFNKILIWAVSLLAFWTASRMGELLQNNSAIDLIRCITWGKIKIITDTHYTIFYAVPKCSETPQGTVVDIYKFSDQNYCPIFNLDVLYKACRKMGRGKNYDAAFLMDNGDYFSTSKMNHFLKLYLKPFFSNLSCNYTCHSFRAALPSFMASHPEIFSVNDIKDTCRWKSDTVHRYTRLHGIAQNRVLKRVYSNISK